MPDPAVLALLATAAFAASVLGGMSGYGVGLILPMFLAPVIGVKNVIPVMAVATALTNASRLLAFRKDFDRALALRVVAFAAPACIVGSWVYTLASSRWVAAAIGVFLIASVVIRRRGRVRTTSIGTPALQAGAAGFGLLAGGMTGTGPLLLALLMQAGAQGAALIGTDAAVSLAMNAVKVTVFGSAALLDARLLAYGLLLGLATVPGAFVARWLLKAMPVTLHLAVMDVVILLGAAGFLWRAFAD